MQIARALDLVISAMSKRPDSKNLNEPEMMANAEKIISKNLRTIVKTCDDGEIIDDSAELQEVLTALEFYIPEILRRKYRFWKYESLDGVFAQKTVKMKSNEIEITGMCILISDQTLTPLHLRIKVNEDHDEIDWLKCNVGEKTEDGMLKIPYESTEWVGYALTKDLDEIDWVYEIKVHSVHLRRGIRTCRSGGVRFMT